MKKLLRYGIEKAHTGLFGFAHAAAETQSDPGVVVLGVQNCRQVVK